MSETSGKHLERESHPPKSTESPTPLVSWSKDDQRTFQDIRAARTAISGAFLPDTSLHLSDAFASATSSRENKTADRPTEARDGGVQNPKVESERKRLHDLAEQQIKDPEKLSKFRTNMQDFERRAQQAGLSPEEVAKTYGQVSRLLDKNQQTRWALPEEQRTTLAQQVVAQAARPYSIDQGAHNTCNVTAVEVRTYALHPSNAAKLVADVGTSQSYHVNEPKPRGTEVKLNPRSLQPDDESRMDPPKDGNRSYATQVFNVAATNMMHKLDGTRRVYVNEPDGSREKLVDQNHKGTVADEPDLDDSQIARAYHAINDTRGKEKTVMIDAAGNVSGSSRDVTLVRTQKELEDKLAEAKRNKQFPIIVGVSANVEPFWKDSGHGSAGGSEGGHVVNITDYEPGPPAKVSIDNQWGSKADHNGKPSLAVRDLYIAMQTEKDAEKLLAKDVAAARAAGKPDDYKELEHLRLTHFNAVGRQKEREEAGKPLTAQQMLDEYKSYAAKLEQQISTTTKRWEQQKKDGTYNPEEAERVREKIGTMIDDPNLPPSAQLRILKCSRDGGLITDAGYEKNVSTVLRQFASLKDAGPKKPQGAFQQKEYADSLPEVARLIKAMPADQRDRMIKEGLGDADMPIKTKIEFLRGLQATKVLSPQEFASVARPVFDDYKQKQEAGEYSTAYRQKTQASIETQRQKLLSEMTADERAALERR